MALYEKSARATSRTDSPFNPGQRHRANFARQAIFAEFQARDAKAILQPNFLDRLPGQSPRPSPGARFR